MSEQTAQVQSPEKEKTKQRRGGILLLVLLIIVLLLFLLTSIILGSRLYNLATRDRYRVDLVLGEMSGDLELFKIAYTGTGDEITVEGVNGEKVVAPGTSIDYDVRLRNQDDVIIDFVMAPTVEHLAEDAIPIQFRLMDSYGNYILGSDTHWATADEMNAFSHKGSVHPGEVYTYHLSWQWPFESGNDEYDTHLGNSEDPGIRVSLATESSASSVEAKTPSHLMHLLGEGFGCCWCCWLVWILLLIILIMVLWVWRLKRSLKKQDKQLEEYRELLQKHSLHPEQ